MPLWWRFFVLLTRPKLAKAVARVSLDGYLAETGWLRTVATGEVADAFGRPVPWATYPFVEFITPRLKPDWRVFEYGAGASTRFFAGRVREVWAVDHDAAFAAKLTPQLPGNAHVVVRPQGSAEYFSAIAVVTGGAELINIDGRDRVRCAEFAVRHVAPEGVIVFDDTERADYAPALEQIVAAGFRRLDFWGISAGAEMHRCTTVFYRSANVLGL